ncbi:MAG TPA: hypothetical protein PK405_09240 [Hyphomicrobiales bacterium]|nr:hypothetical protein [Rhodobiaceae bacterium]HXK54856.1 hypothetical protein [Hyphomicrobiales bacterium]
MSGRDGKTRSKGEEARRERLAAALRANLQRRKQQTRHRARDDEAEGETGSPDKIGAPADPGRFSGGGE